MTTVPLSYDSLRTVLQYMEANQRLQLSRRVPSIRKTDAAVPFNIKHLAFGLMSTTINKTTYEMNVCRHSHTGCRKDILFKRTTFEHDRYGFWTDPDSFPLTDGDLGFRREREEGDKVAEFDENRWPRLKKKYEGLIRELAYSKELSQKPDVSETMLYICQQNIRAAEGFIPETREELKKYYRRINNIDPPFTHYLQLTVTTRHERKHNEHLEYSEKKLYEAMRYLNSIIFEGRKHLVQVETIDPFFSNFVVRLPANFKIKLKNWSIEPVLFRVFAKAIDLSSCPLNCVTINDVDGLEHEFAKSAMKLVIKNSVHNDDWLPTLLGLSNDCVILEVEDLSHQTYMEFIRNRLQYGIPSGTHFTFVMTRKDNIRNLLRECYLIKGATRERRIVTIPMNGNSVLNVSYEVKPQNDRLMSPRYNFIVEIKQKGD